MDTPRLRGRVLWGLAALLLSLPEMGLAPWPPGPVHGVAAILWLSGFML